MKKSIFGIIFCIIFLWSCRSPDVTQNSISSLQTKNSNLYDTNYVIPTEEEVEKEILKMKDIKKCTVYITGETALIGVISDKSDEKYRELHREVTERAHDVGVKYVSVTFNEKIYKMIDNLKYKE